MIETELQLNRLDRFINALSPRWGVKRAYNRARLQLAQYRSAETTRLKSDWITFGPDSGTPPSNELQIMRNRSRYATRNDPVAAGALDTLKTNIVGSGLNPQSRIRTAILGISEERAGELQDQAEAAWEKFKPLADAANILNFDEIQFLALAKIIEDGETIVIPTWADEDWRPFGRCIELLESERLAQPVNPKTKNKNTIKNGIEFGDRGQPLFYHIRKANSLDDYNRIAARDKNGRPKILHIYPTRRPGQNRGIPFFAPVLSYFKDLADYLEAEIVAARVAACLAVFVTKNDPMFAATYMQSKTEDSTGARIQGIEPGLVGYLAPGESINVVDPKRPGESFGSFVENVLRLIGVAIGLPYELLVKDFSKTNYSSARAALLEGRRMFMTWRNWFAKKFCQPIWELVLEEAYLRGEFDAPDFYQYSHEYCRANWIGGGWGWVDPVKEVEASRKAIDYGLSTMAEEAAGQGRDWEEIIDQRKREDEKIASAQINIWHAAKEKGDEQDAKSE